MEKLFENLKNLNERLEKIDVNNDAVIELKIHGNNVAKVAEFIAKKENIPKDKIKTLKRAAFLHDAGKIMLYPLVRKKEKLTTEEKLLMHLHPILSLLVVEIYAEKNNIEPLSKEEILYILYHHTHPVNSVMQIFKYEDKDEIAKILTFADITSAICEKRNYKEEREISIKFIISELEEERRKYKYSKEDFVKFYKYIPDIFKIIKKGDENMNNKLNNNFSMNFNENLLNNTKEYDELLEKAEKMIEKTFEEANNSIEKETEKNI